MHLVEGCKRVVGDDEAVGQVQVRRVRHGNTLCRHLSHVLNPVDEPARIGLNSHPRSLAAQMERVKTNRQGNVRRVTGRAGVDARAAFGVAARLLTHRRHSPAQALHQQGQALNKSL